MNKLSLALASLALCGAAHAGSIVSNFQVTVNFTSACQATAPTLLAFGTYTAFAADLVAPTPVTFSYQCSRGAGAAATFAISGGSGSTSGAASTGYFSTAGLNYFLTLGTKLNTPGNAASAANGAIGSADATSITIGGTIPQQAGINNGAATPGILDTDNRVLTITF